MVTEPYHEMAPILRANNQQQSSTKTELKREN